MHLDMFFIIIFLVFLGFFSVFGAGIADYVAWVLAMSNEISLSKEQQGGEVRHTSIQLVSDSKLAKVKAKISRKVATASISLDARFKKPVTANLPKTKTPTISFSEDVPEWDDGNLTLFTPLRKYDGTLWQEEKTAIKGSTDGKKLYLICRFYDKTPHAAVTEHTESRGGENAWQDDSIEIFLMKNRKSKFYCQYIVSVSGKGTIIYDENTKAPNRGTKVTIPQGFIKPRYSVDDFAGGFEFEISIALSNIGIDKLKPGDALLMQIVRNYRGQQHKESVTLHLFPVYIYADKRFGINNHDRRAFQKIVVK